MKKERRKKTGAMWPEEAAVQQRDTYPPPVQSAVSTPEDLDFI